MQPPDFIQWLFGELQKGRPADRDLMRETIEKLDRVVERAVRGIVTESGEFTMEPE